MKQAQEKKQQEIQQAEIKSGGVLVWYPTLLSGECH
jgi:hypothetical protein